MTLCEYEGSVNWLQHSLWPGRLSPPILSTQSLVWRHAPTVLVEWSWVHDATTDRTRWSEYDLTYLCCSSKLDIVVFCTPSAQNVDEDLMLCDCYISLLIVFN